MPEIIGKNFQEDFLETFLQFRFPNQFVIAVRCVPSGEEREIDSEVAMNKKVAQTMSIATGLAEEDLLQGIILNDYCLVNFGQDEKKANEVFKLFPEEEFPYTVLFGPVPEPFRKDWAHIAPGPAQEELKAIRERELEFGMWLTENT